MNVSTGERSWTDRIAQLSGNGALACLLGLAAVRVWIQCILFDSYIQADDGIFTIINNFAYGAAILTGALVALRRPPGARMQSRLGWIAFALMIVAPLGLLAIPGQLTLGQMAGVGLVAGVAGGMGAGVWTALYARLGVQQIVLFGFSSLALGSIGGFAVSFLPADPSQVVSIFMAAVAQMCYRHALEVIGPSESPAGVGAYERPWSQTDPEPVYDREPKTTAWLILGGLAVFGFALGISRGYPAGEPITMGPPLRALHQFGVVGLSLLVMHWTIGRGRRLSFSLLWRIEIAVAALGALTLSVLPDEFDALAIALENIADSFMLGVLWVTMADAARHSSRHAYTVFGIAWAVRVFSREAGRVLILVLGSVAAAPQTGVVIGAVTAAIGASMALLLSENVPHTRPFFELDETEEACIVRGTCGAGEARVQTGEARARTGEARIRTGDARARTGEARIQTGDARARTGEPRVWTGNDKVRPLRARTSTDNADSFLRAPRGGETQDAPDGAVPTAKTAQSRFAQGASVNADSLSDRRQTAATRTSAARGQVASVAGAAMGTSASLDLDGADAIALSPAEVARLGCLRADFGLSEREAQVAVLIAQGRSKAAIARCLYVSENTVRTHAKNAYSKLGVCSKMELEALLETLGKR